MTRKLLALAACLVVAAPVARAQSPGELAETAAHAASLQNADGGFGPKAGASSSLGATSSAIRILGYTGGSIPDVLAALQFVKSCVHADSGGFAPTPGGKADVGTTASGLMALKELKILDVAIVKPALKYLSENAKTYEEVRIAVAGFEAANETSADDFKRWSTEILATRNADGTFGEGDGKARETGGKAVALRRMGVSIDKENAIVAYLRSTQNPDGGWSKGEGGSDLEATYRIMRFFFMAKEAPDLDRLNAFIARCRHENGSYGVKPDDASTGGTYFATILSRWCRLLNHEPALVETAGFQPLFDGKTLAGWEGDATLWSARAGMLVGDSKGLKHNDFLATEKSYANFVLKLTFHLVNGDGNSGVQFRSVRVPNHEMSGFQADIGQNYWGCLYDESRRNKVLVQASEAARKNLHEKSNNNYVIEAKGDEIRLTLNGATSVNYHETDPAIARDGRIAVQLHAGGPTVVRFKNVYIQPLPDPKEGTDDAPGFHMRTLKAGDDARKYSVYIPTGYDGKKTFPVVLFLHGSGERGSDGLQATQVGLGPAIFNHPERFPAIAVIPQARKSWEADSEDAKAALAALDEVLGSLKGDSDRVILTGLSMGGRGAWEIASAQPQRFAAVIPICGNGKPDSAKTLASLPVWTLVGDDDRAGTVHNTRAMVEAIRSAGGKAMLTEYRGVGHNSWDRAYNDPTLIEWMLARSRR